jgi:hypothetical protein
MHQVVIRIMFNHGCLYPDNTRWKEHRLCKAGSRVEGKQYWVEHGEDDEPCDKTWVSDERADEIIQHWTKLTKILSI